MARCPNCYEEVSDDARFCPHCGIAQPRRRDTQEQQPPLPFSPWASPPMTAQPAGNAGAVPRAEPVVGPPLSPVTVAIAMGSIFLFLLFVVIIGRGGINFGSGGGARQAGEGTLPVVGVKGEAVDIGQTTWGVAFTDQVERVDDRPPTRGQFYAVGIVLGNRGQSALNLSTTSVGLVDGSGTRYTPTVTAWGTPDEITAGRYASRYTLPPREAIAGLIVFDVPVNLAQPSLLVRDLTAGETAFTGRIDLTQEKPTESRIRWQPVH